MEVGIKKLNRENLNRLKKYCIFDYSFKNELLLCKYRDNKAMIGQFFEYNTITGKYTIDASHCYMSKFFYILKSIFPELFND